MGVVAADGDELAVGGFAGGVEGESVGADGLLKGVEADQMVQWVRLGLATLPATCQRLACTECAGSSQTSTQGMHPHLCRHIVWCWSGLL